MYSKGSISSKYLLKKLFPVGIAKVTTVSGAIILQWVLAQHITLAEVGDFVTITIVLTGLGVLFRSGTDQLLLREIGKTFPEDNKENTSLLFSSVIRYLIKRGVLFSILASPFLIYYSTRNKDALDSYYLWILTIAPIYALFVPVSAFYRATNRHVIAPLWEQGGVSLITSVLLIVLTPVVSISFNGAVIIFFLVIATMISPFITRAYQYPKVCLSKYKTTLTDFWLIQMSAYFSQWGVVLTLGIFKSSEQVGLLTTSLRLAMLVNFVLVIFNSVLAPRFASYSQDHTALKTLAKKSTLMMVVIAAIPSSVLIFAPEKVLALFGEEYISGSVMLQIFAAGQLFNVFTGSILVALNMTGYQRYVRQIVLFTGLISISLIAPIAIYAGMIGSAIFIVCINALTNIIAISVAKRKLGFTTLPI